MSFRRHLVPITADPRPPRQAPRTPPRARTRRRGAVCEQRAGAGPYRARRMGGRRLRRRVLRGHLRGGSRRALARRARTRDHRARRHSRRRAVRERADAWLAERARTRRAGVRSARLARRRARAAGRAGRGRHHRMLPRRARRAPARRRGRLDRVRADHDDPGRVRGDRRGPRAALLARAVPRARRPAARRGAPAVPPHLARPAAARPLVEPARGGADGSRRRGRVPAARPCAP